MKDKRMKAYVYTEKGIIQKKELPVPELNEGKNPEDSFAAVLRPLFLSPCSSDVHTVYAGKGPSRDNLVLGHEGIAQIVKTGSMVRDFRPGDVVAVSPVMPEVEDGTGHENAHFSGMKLGRAWDGEWAEFFKIPDADMNLAFIPEGLSMEAALMAVDVMSTGFTAALQSGIEKGDDVTVIGSGAIGLMAAAAARELGAGNIFMIGTGRSEKNVKLAGEYGVNCYIDYHTGDILYASEEIKSRAAEQTDEEVYASKGNAYDDPSVDRLLRLTGGNGTAKVLICGGDRRSVGRACDMVRYGDGVVINMNYIEGEGDIPLPVFSLGRGMAGKTFKFMLSRGGRHYLEKMLLRAKNGRPDPAPLVTHRLEGFDSIPEALELMRRRPEGLIKIMIEVQEWKR